MRVIHTHEINELNRSIEINAPERLTDVQHVYTLRVAKKPETYISLQQGEVKDVGVNGLSIEAMLAIAHDRLLTFQGGGYPCEENVQAITCIETALKWLERRAKRVQP